MTEQVPGTTEAYDGDLPPHLAQVNETLSKFEPITPNIPLVGSGLSQPSIIRIELSVECPLAAQCCDHRPMDQRGPPTEA